MKINIEKRYEDAKLPTYAHPGDSGMDIYSLESVVIPPGETVKIRTGLKIAVPEGYEAQVRPKSGLALTHKITVANTPGTVDSGYRGEVCVLLRNEGHKLYPVNKLQKIAQIVICPVIHAELIEVSDLDDTERGDGGFGSTGV